MKTKNLVLSFALSLSAITLLSSSLPSGSHSLRIGGEAPAITIASNSELTLDSLKGNYLLVNFWSASDAQSRINNRIYAGMESLDGHKIKVLSVCLDEDKVLAAEIAKADGIESGLHLMGSDLNAEVLADYQVEAGCRAFLIDPYGNLERIL